VTSESHEENNGMYKEQNGKIQENLRTRSSVHVVARKDIELSPFYYARSQPCKAPFVCLSVCLSASKISKTTEQIFLEFELADFYKKLSCHFYFHLGQIILLITLHCKSINLL
jgi:hypothetical protein